MDVYWKWAYFTLLWFGTYQYHEVLTLDIHHTNKSIPPDNNKSETEAYIKFWHDVNHGHCDAGYVSYQNGSLTLCCIPVVCGPGNEIIPCSMNKTSDKCELCKTGYLQLKNISSIDMGSTSCFPRDKNHEDCPIDDMKPSRENFSEYSLPLPCECKNEICYYPDKSAGTCRRASKCPPGKYMDIISGVCVACEWYAYKDDEGCQPCIINIDWLRFGRSYSSSEHVSPTSTTTTTSVTEGNGAHTNGTITLDEVNIGGSSNPPKDDNTLIIIVVIVCVAVVITAFLLTILFLFRRRICFAGNSQAGTTSSAPLLNGSPPTSAPTTPVNGLNNNLVYTDLTHHLSNGITQNGVLSHNGVVLSGLPSVQSRVENDRLQGNIDGCIAINGGSNHGNGHIATDGGSNHSNGYIATNGESNQGDTVQMQRKSNIDNHKPSTSANISQQDTAENNRDETGRKKPYAVNHISIHGNTFNNSQINIHGRKVQYAGLSGSFIEESSLDSRIHPSEPPTLVQPGRRGDDSQCNGAYGVQANMENGATGVEPSSRPEYNRYPDDFTYRQEDQLGARHREMVAMETLNKPQCAFETGSDVTANNYSNDTTNVSLPVRKDNVGVQRPQQVRAIAKVAPMCQNNSTNQQSLHHISGYQSRGINESDDSTVSRDTVSSNGYMFANLSTNIDSNDIADTRDFSTLNEHSDVPDADTDPGTDIAFPGDRRQDGGINNNMSQRTPVYPVKPITQPPDSCRGNPDGKSHESENTLLKVTINDETDPKSYYNSSCHGDNNSHHSDKTLMSQGSNTDLKKINDGSLSDVELDLDSTGVKFRKHHNNDFDKTNKNHDDDFDKSSKLNEKINSTQELDDGNVKMKSDNNDKECDNNKNAKSDKGDGDNTEKVSTESVDSDKLVTNQSGINECVESRSKVETSADESVDTDRFKKGESCSGANDNDKVASQSCSVVSDEIGQEDELKLSVDSNGDDKGKSFEYDIDTDGESLSNPTSVESDESYELGGSIDIQAIRDENKHIQDITCRGETMNSMSSEFRGLNPS